MSEKEKKLTRQDLKMAGELLFGDRWQASLARSLRSRNGKPYDSAAVRKWMRKATNQNSAPIPLHINSQLHKLLEQRISELNEILKKWRHTPPS